MESPGSVKAIVAVGLLALVVALVLALGGGDHGPGRHQPGPVEHPIGVTSTVELRVSAAAPVDRR